MAQIPVPVVAAPRRNKFENSSQRSAAARGDILYILNLGRESESGRPAEAEAEAAAGRFRHCAHPHLSPTKCGRTKSDNPSNPTAIGVIGRANRLTNVPLSRNEARQDTRRCLAFNTDSCCELDECLVLTACGCLHRD